MKKILLLVALSVTGIFAFSQSTLLLRGDTIRAYKHLDSAYMKIDSFLNVSKQATIGKTYLPFKTSVSLDLTDSTRAILMNRMHSRLNVVTPENGMFIYEDSTDQFLRYEAGAWTAFSAGSGNNIYNTDGILTGDRNLSGLNNTYYLQFDSLNAFLVNRAGQQRIYMNSLATLIYSPDNTQYIGTENDSSYVIADNNNMIWKTDSTLSRKKISYYGNIHSTFNDYSLVDKGYVDSLAGTIGGGTPGGSDKQVQYNNAGAFGGSAGFETALTNLRTKITAQATTEVPLEIKLASSQTANAFNVSSSAGTGDLASIDKDGTIRTAKSFIAIGDLSLRAGTPAGVYAGIDLTTTTYPGIWFGTNSSSANVNDFAFLFNESSGQTAFNTPNSSGSINFRIDNEYNNSLLYHSNLNLGVGFAYNGTPTGRVHIAAGTATAGTAPLKFTAGTHLSTTEAGAIEYNGTHLYFTAANSGPRYQLDRQADLTKSKGIFIQAPTSADVVDVWQTPVAITITSLKAILRGTTPSVTYNIRFGTDITSATDVFTSDITCTSVTTGCSNSSGFNDATIPAGSFIWIITSAASGTINSIGFTINYTED